MTELAGAFAVSRSAISQHLLLLAEVGLVTARKWGRNRYYSLEEAGMARTGSPARTPPWPSPSVSSPD